VGRGDGGEGRFMPARGTQPTARVRIQATKVNGAMQRTEIEVNLGERSYPIVVSSDAIGSLGAFVRQRWRGHQALVVCDRHTEHPYAERVAGQLAETAANVGWLILEPGEPSKSLESAARGYDELVRMAADRRTLVAAVGGGVVGDLAGFVAATYARGLPFLQVPTSLLAQVDSSVGGKVGVNHRGPDGRITKNMIGAFHQPIGVVIDTNTLASLPARELRAGLAEVVKYGVILDADFFAFLESHADAILALEPKATGPMIARSCRLKAAIVEEDERELSERRAVLNYGHTFAHAIEAVSHELVHGEAVAIGMVAASRLAQRLDRISAETTERQVRLLERFGLPTAARGLDPDALVEAMQRDKKTRAGRLRFVLPRSIGRVELCDDVDVSAVRRVIADVLA
jgi:3-dehydroquinate synthase